MNLLKHEDTWCKFMGFFNPYIDHFKYHLCTKMPVYDPTCYRIYPNERRVYDKLWVMKSQNLKCGTLNKDTPFILTEYPVFIKPRWGHLTASSKNCFKIDNVEELRKYAHYKNMMWSEFINATEGMTDFFLQNGKICHQITYVYSDKQNGFTDDWKLVSTKSTPPLKITDWVDKYMRNFTGIVNVQYRADKIIEVGLRAARGGAYLVSTENEALIKNINKLYLEGSWEMGQEEQMHFQDFYVYKCFTTMPIVYLFPQYFMDYFIQRHTHKPFYEYYFEPAGKSGMVFYQFMDDDFERGMQTKKRLEWLFASVQIVILVLFIVCIYFLFFQANKRIGYVVSIIFVLFFLTRFLNPFSSNYNLYKAQRQNIFSSGPAAKPNGVDVDDDA